MPIDFTSAAWLHVAQWAASEVERLRQRNDATDLTAEQTATLRGEIRFAKRLLGLPEAAARGRSAESAYEGSFGGTPDPFGSNT
jgi:hypothetical protein